MSRISRRRTVGPLIVGSHDPGDRLVSGPGRHSAECWWRSVWCDRGGGAGGGFTDDIEGGPLQAPDASLLRDATNHQADAYGQAKTES